MGFLFSHGDPLMVDYTPSGVSIKAGDVVVFAGKACIAHNPIADGALGALAWPNGRAVYEYDGAFERNFVFTSGEDEVASGGTLYVEGTNGNLSADATSNYAVGIVNRDVGPADNPLTGTLVIHGG